jgi:diguanylate cyclase (GGDEF)-like protein
MGLLVGVLLAGVAANVAMFAWLSRADHIKIHWPRQMLPLIEALQRLDGEPALPERRRPVFAADRPSRRSSDRAAATAPFRMTPAPYVAGSSLTGKLPPDLAEFVARPAPLAADGHGSDGARYEVASGALARVQGWSPPSGGTGLAADQLTGLEGPDSWSRIVEIENARLMRYRRPVTVVVAEIEGLRRLAERLGDDPAERLLPVVADAFRREARTSDWIARIGYGRFAALLPETDEIRAINYVERIRQVCEPWLASSAVPLRLAIGWSSPAASADLEFAIARAEERMHADRRTPGKPLPPSRLVAARVVSVPSGSPAAVESLEEFGGSVSPAETGREEHDPEAVSAVKGPPDAQPVTVAHGKGRSRTARAAAGSDGRTTT